MSAITAALSQIDRVAAEGDLAPDPAAPLELETAGEPILLPDGKRIYPPCLHGQPIDQLALALLDMHDPAAVDVPAADRPARRGQEPDRPRDRLPPLDRPRPRGRRAARRPVLRVRRAAARTVVGRVLLPLRLRPGRRERGPGGAGRLGVRAGDARGVGGDDRRGQHRPRRRAAVDQRHARRPPDACTSRRPGRRSSPSPGSRSCSPTTRGWSARPTSPTPGTRGSPRRSRSRATGRRSRSSARRRRSSRRRCASTASGSPARTGSAGRRSSATSSRCGG